MKYYILYVLLIVPNALIAQNGTYGCTLQGYNRGTEAPILYYHNQLITIEVNENFGGWVIIDTPADNFRVRYDLAPRPLTTVDKDDKKINIAYAAKSSLNNVEMTDELLFIFIEGINDDKLDISIYTPKFKAYNSYMNLKKIKIQDILR